MTDYRCIPCEDLQAWDALVAESPQGNVFCSSRFLGALDDVRFEPWLVLRNDRPEAGAVVLTREGVPAGVGYHLCPYLGVLMSSHVSSTPIHRRSRWTLEILDSLLGTLTQKYRRLRFAFHPSFEDLRPFQWHNYHEPGKGQFDVALRYTGLIRLAGLEDFDAYLMTLPKTRRYEYRQALTRGYRVVGSRDVDALVHLHQQSFLHQGLSCSERELAAVRKVAGAAMDRGLGQLLACQDPEGNLASIALFMEDHRWGYHVTGGNDPAYRNEFSGTFLLLDYVRRAMESGLEAVDVVGMNSPARGSFKSSFNAALVPYHVAQWEAPR